MSPAKNEITARVTRQPACIHPQMKTAVSPTIVLILTAFSATVALGATNLVVNPGFESGNAGFVTSYVYTPSASSSGTALGANQYVVGSDPRDYHNLAVSYGDHTGGGNMLIANGSNNTSSIVWQSAATIVITPDTDYFFEVWASNWTAVAGAGARLTFQVMGSLGVWETLGTTNFDGSVAGVWTSASQTWNSGLSTTAELRILNAQPALVGNDFALDDIHFSSESSIPEPTSAVLAGVFGICGMLRRRR